MISKRFWTMFDLASTKLRACTGLENLRSVYICHSALFSILTGFSVVQFKDVEAGDKIRLSVDKGGRSWF
jgi:hypothetical protein